MKEDELERLIEKYIFNSYKKFRTQNMMNYEVQIVNFDEALSKKTD